jgi:hypothetical protein
MGDLLGGDAGDAAATATLCYVYCSAPLLAWDLMKTGG